MGSRKRRTHSPPKDVTPGALWFETLELEDLERNFSVVCVLFLNCVCGYSFRSLTGGIFYQVVGDSDVGVWGGHRSKVGVIGLLSAV